MEVLQNYSDIHDWLLYFFFDGTAKRRGYSTGRVSACNQRLLKSYNAKRSANLSEGSANR